MKKANQSQKSKREMLSSLKKDKKQHMLCLAIPTLSEERDQLKTRLVHKGSKLIIFCCLKKGVKPAIITVEGLDQIRVSPNIVINAQKIHDYCDLKFILDERDLRCFPNIILNDKQNEALILPSYRKYRALEMMKVNLETFKVNFRKDLKEFSTFGRNQLIWANIDNHGYANRGILVELHQRSLRSKTLNKTIICRLNPKTDSLIKVLILNQFKTVKKEKRLQMDSYGKIDKNALFSKADCLAYFRFFDLHLRTQIEYSENKNRKISVI